MSRRILIEENIGETRAAVVDNGRVVELWLDRWSEAGQRVVEGEIYRGRVRRVEPALNAAFVDLGVGPEGFLPFGKAGRPKGFHEGAAIGVRIAREAYAEKGPNLALAEAGGGGTAGGDGDAGGAVRVSVRDTGPGIPESDRERVFERFFIGDESRSRSRDGSGLGLAICRRIVELHHGTIGVAAAPNGGAEFWFTLPA